MMPTELNGWQMLSKGGPMMIPIAVCSVAAVGIVLEKFWFFSKDAKATPLFKNQVFTAVRNNTMKDAVALCEAENTPLARILKAGLLKAGTSREEIRDAMEAASSYEVPGVEKGLTGLATIVTVSPLLGLLGTVLGLTANFYAIQMSATQQMPMTPADLASGIWQALLSTVGGLTVAIPAYLFYQYLNGRVQDYIVVMERAATELLHLLTAVTETVVPEEAED